MARKKKSRPLASARDVVETITVIQTEALQESVNHSAVAALAYEFWLQRGCPIGSPEEDWFRAEAEIKNGQMTAASAVT
jgi:hypothetical protein